MDKPNKDKDALAPDKRPSMSSEKENNNITKKPTSKSSTKNKKSQLKSKMTNNNDNKKQIEAAKNNSEPAPKKKKIQPISSQLSSTDINPDEITLIISPSTGGTFTIQVKNNISVADLKYTVARKMQMPKEKFNLIFKEKVLKWGTILEYKIEDNSRLSLIPKVETGFAAGIQNTEQSIVQAIEGLSDKQIDEFLSGRAPLTLALRVDDHMMFVQLQLEQTPNNNAAAASGASNTRDQQKKAIQNSNQSQNPNQPSSSNQKVQAKNQNTEPQNLAQTELLKTIEHQQRIQKALQENHQSQNPQLNLQLARQNEVLLQSIQQQRMAVQNAKNVSNATQNQINNQSSSIRPLPHTSSGVQSSKNSQSSSTKSSTSTTVSGQLAKVSQKDGNKLQNGSKTGACINTFVRHGPGVFSGSVG